MEDEKSKKDNVLVEAAKALGSAVGKVASIAKTATPPESAPSESAPMKSAPMEATPESAGEPPPPRPATKSSKKMKLAPKNKSRLPRREKKAQKTAARKAAGVKR